MSSDPLSATISTGAYLEKLQLTWRIENFDDIRRSVELITKQKITIRLGENINFPTKWCCYLIPTKSDTYNPLMTANQVGIYIKLVDAPPSATELVTGFRARIKKDNRPLTPCIYNYIQNGRPTPGNWGCTNFVLQDAVAIHILTNCNLLIEVELKLLSIEKEEESTSVSSLESIYKVNFIGKLQSDMAKLLPETVRSNDSQTKIISKDNVEINVNRGALSARSPVFELMFQAEMTESKSGIIRITDLSSDTITVLLHFLYTGMLHENWRSADILPEFVYAAGKYQLPDLLGFFDDVIGKVCCKENAGRLVGHARKLGLKQAEKDLVDFIKCNISSLDDMISFAEDCTASNFV